MIWREGRGEGMACGEPPRSTYKLSTVALTIPLLAVVLAGCLYQGFHARGIEPQVRSIEPLPYQIVGEAEGTSSQFNLLWIIPVTPRISFDRAVNEAISAKNGDTLIVVRTWVERQVWFVGMIEVLHVKGKVVKYIK